MIVEGQMCTEINDNLFKSYMLKWKACNPFGINTFLINTFLSFTMRVASGVQSAKEDRAVEKGETTKKTT